MLKIENIDKLEKQEFSSAGIDWLVYRTEEQYYQYRFIFMPKDGKAWALNKTSYVYLSREPLVFTKESYRIYSGHGESYIQFSELKDMWNIITKICKEDLIK